jgi:hypothetical protein
MILLHKDIVPDVKNVKEILQDYGHRNIEMVQE